MSGPSRVFILRHGEKLGDPSNDKDGMIHLSLRGSARAAAIPSLFQAVSPGQDCAWSTTGNQVTSTYTAYGSDKVNPTYLQPDFLFATAPSGNSNRPVETITPLSVALGLSIDAKHSDGDYGKVATDVLTNSKYDGKVVLLCWHHGNIPALATALKAADVCPKWGGLVFDRVWQIPFTNGAAGAVVNSPQSLLYGDASI